MLKQKLIHLLEELALTEDENFSGVGLVVYQANQELSNYHCDLVPDSKPDSAFMLGDERLVTYLRSIAAYNHRYHDGFHFIDQTGLLTRVAQFFSPPIDNSVSRRLGQGARTFCSLCGSNVPGVLFVGSVSSTRKICLFAQGELILEQDNAVNTHSCL